MKKLDFGSFTQFAFIGWLSTVVVLAADNSNDISFIGEYAIPGNAKDLSNQTGSFLDGTPCNQLGGFSAVAYSGKDNHYWVLPDRGPNDGMHPYHCRLHEVEIVIDANADCPVRANLLATHMLVDYDGQPFVGSASAQDPQHAMGGRRLDPEGIRVLGDGTLIISDEYGPHLLVFTQQGQLKRRIEIPEHLQVAVPADSTEQESQLSTHGRQSNRGLEGIALTPDGESLIAAFQQPLLQDLALDEDGKASGVNTRLLRVDLKTGRMREFVYPLSSPGYGVSEVLAIDENRLIILERDSVGGEESRFKRLFSIDTAGATDVLNIDTLPANNLPSDIRPVAKHDFLDLLDKRYALLGRSMPAKIEGLAFGPDLPDGRRTLIVCSDNDFRTGEATRIFVFACPR